MKRLARSLLGRLVLILATSCAGQEALTPTAPSPQPSTGPSPQPQTFVSTETATLVGAGDIAVCGFINTELTARLLASIPGTVFTAGDNAYQDANAQDFAQCYEPTWGRHKARTRPAPGDHDYRTPGAAAYFDYFGSQAGPSGLGYYSYQLGAWHVLALNSRAPTGPGSPEYEWLLSELRTNRSPCRLAYWHFPVFSSGFGGNISSMRAIWKMLVEFGTDVVVVGHAHNYERFARLDSERIRASTVAFLDACEGLLNRLLAGPEPKEE